ncbi:tetratricopeptide repeat protein, partial [Streptomyces sp. NPDC000880]
KKHDKKHENKKDNKKDKKHEKHPDTLVTRHEMAHFLGRMGQWVTAAEMYDTVARARTRVLGAAHPDTHAAQRDADRARAHLGDPPSGKRPPGPRG